MMQMFSTGRASADYSGTGWPELSPLSREDQVHLVLFFLKESRLYEAALLSGGTRSAGQPPEGFGGVMAEGHVF